MATKRKQAKKTTRKAPQRKRPNALEQATAAGTQYAEDQIQSDHFSDWVRDQISEGEQLRRRGEDVIDDTDQIARNMLQQLKWDIMRDLDVPREFAGNDEAVQAYAQGIRNVLEGESARTWLSEEIKYIQEERAGQQASEKTRVREQRGSISRDKIQSALAIVHRNGRSPVAVRDAILNTGLNDAEIDILLNSIHVKRSELGPLTSQVPHKPRPMVRDYEAIDSRARRIAGPFKTYGDAKQAAGPAGTVKFVPSKAREHAPRRPTAAPTGSEIRDFNVVELVVTPNGAEHWTYRARNVTRGRALVIVEQLRKQGIKAKIVHGPARGL